MQGRLAEPAAGARFVAGLLGVAPGAAAGLLVGVIVVLVSLPLHSPHDSLMNSGTIGVASLLTSVALGLAWRLAARRTRPAMMFAAMCLAALGAAAVGAVVVEFAADLERSISFIVPLAAIQFGVAAIAAPLLARRNAAAAVLVAILAAVLLGLGFGLAGQGDQPSGTLELPARST